MIEKKWRSVPSVALTATGSVDGKLTVVSAHGFKVKMIAVLTDPSLSPLKVEIKRITSPTQIEVGLPDTPITSRTDVSSYSSTSSIYAPEQSRASIPIQEVERATYEEEPTVGKRSYLVDEYGRPLTNDEGFLKTVTMNKLVTVSFDEIDVTYDSITQNPTTILYKKSGNTVSTLSLSYDANENLTQVLRT